MYNSSKFNLQNKLDFFLNLTRILKYIIFIIILLLFVSIEKIMFLNLFN